jgi:hypothetical protein
MGALLCSFLVFASILSLEGMDLAVSHLLGEPIRKVGGFLDLGGHFFFHIWFLKRGATLPCGLPGVKSIILVAPLDATSIYFLNVNSLGRGCKSSGPKHSDDHLD